MGRKRYSDEALLEMGREAASELGPFLTHHEFSRHAGVSAMTIRDRFGGWTEFRERLGLGPRSMVRLKMRRHSRRSIVEALARAARKYGADITLEEFVREAGVSSTTVYRYFSGWPELRLEADLPRNAKAKTRYSDEALLQDMHKVAHLAGRLPTIDDYRTYGHAAVSTLQRRFGPEWMFVQGRYERWVEWKRGGPV